MFRVLRRLLVIAVRRVPAVVLTRAELRRDVARVRAEGRVREAVVGMHVCVTDRLLDLRGCGGQIGAGGGGGGGGVGRTHGGCCRALSPFLHAA